MRTLRTLAQQYVWKRDRRLAIGTGILLLSMLLAPLALASTAQADSADSSGLCAPARRAISLTLPAVVRISTTYQAQLTYFNTDGSSIVFPQDGSSYTVQVTGSGAFISGAGDILTAFDVVNASQADLNTLLAQIAAPDIAQALNDANLSQPVTAADIFNQLLNDPNIWQSSFQPPQSSFYFSSQYAGPATAASLSGLQSFPVTITAQSSPDQLVYNDLAILHVSGLHDLPTMTLGDSSQVYQGDTLTILGYSASTDLPASDGSINPDNFITAAVNTVTVSAFKTTASGAQVIQVAGDAEQSDTGSPALNTDGQLVGVVSTAAQASTGSGQTSFLSTSNAAKTLAKQASVNLAQDTFDQRWAAAYDTCSSTAPGHWHDAYSQYTQIARLYPTFKGVAPYLAYTRAQAAHESPSNQNLALPAWAIVLMVAVAVLAVAASFLLFRRRALRARAGASYAGYGPGLNKSSPYSIPALSMEIRPPPTPQPAASGPPGQVSEIYSAADVSAPTQPGPGPTSIGHWPEPTPASVTALAQHGGSSPVLETTQPASGSETSEQT